jgi:hypothetical protein
MVVVPGLTGAAVSLHASGGSVDWSVSVSNDPNHVVSVSADSGTLTTSAPAATLTVTVSQFVQCGLGSTAQCPSVTISPGGATLALWTGWTLPFPASGGEQPSATPASPSPGNTAPGGTPPSTPSRRITIR